MCSRPRGGISVGVPWDSTAGMRCGNSQLAGPGREIPCALAPHRAKDRHDFPTIEFKTVLRFAIKAMNEMMGRDGLVASYFVIDIFPPHGSSNSKMPLQADGMRSIQTANM